MNKSYAVAFSMALAIVVGMLIYLTFQTFKIKNDYTELQTRHLLIKNQIKCAEKALDILAEVTKEGCVISLKDLQELQNLNCGKSSI